MLAIKNNGKEREGGVPKAASAGHTPNEPFLSRICSWTVVSLSFSSQDMKHQKSQMPIVKFQCSKNRLPHQKSPKHFLQEGSEERSKNEG